MDKLLFNRRFIISPAREDVSLAQEIYKAFSLTSKEYPAMLKIIQERGVKFAREQFELVKKSDFPHKRELWFKEMLGVKIKYE